MEQFQAALDLYIRNYRTTSRFIQNFSHDTHDKIAIAGSNESSNEQKVLVLNATVVSVVVDIVRNIDDTARHPRTASSVF